MHGLGNDFVIIDGIRESFSWGRDTIAQLGDRRTGIGFDQLLVIESATSQDTNLSYRIFNKDGSHAGQCGNGARCVARYYADHYESTENLKMDSPGGTLNAVLCASGAVKLDMGEPCFDPTQIPLQRQLNDTYTIDFNDYELKYGAVSMGNPHAVFQVEDIQKAPVSGLASAVADSRAFPEGVNVGFMQIISPTDIRLRVHERGVGETRACGTGACAAVAVARIWNLIDNKTLVTLPGGALTIHWNGPGHSLTMSGPAEYVFEGRVNL